MKIVSIFAHSLYSMQYSDSEPNEFEKLFDDWQDIEFLENFFNDNIQDIENGFYQNISVEDAVLSTREEAKWLLKEFKRLSQSPLFRNEGLDSLFKPLHNSEHRVILLSKSKGKAQGRSFKKWLRIYGLKIAPNMYVITGGAIKLTATMQERPHTQEELRKLEKVREFLREEGLIDEDAFAELEI